MKIFRSKVLSLFAIVLVALLPVLEVSAQAELLGQYFGNGSTTTFAVPSGADASTVVSIEVDGLSLPYTWATSTTITLAAAPVTGSIVNVKSTPVAVVAERGIFNTISFGEYSAQGAAVSMYATTTGSADFDSALTLADPADIQFTVTGAAANDICIVGLPTVPTAGWHYRCFVSAANTVQLRATNGTGGTVNPGALTFRVTVIKSSAQ